MAAKPKNLEIRAEEDTTRTKLLQSAADVFAEKGFGGSTVKEISERAGVNISLISYHFNGKEGLFRACLERFGRERLQDSEKILTPPQSIEDMRVKLRLWAQQFLQCHVDEHNVCEILHRENIVSHQFMWEIFEGTFLKNFQVLVKFFESAQKSKLIKKEVDVILSTTFFFGSLVQLGHNEEIQQKWMGVSIRDDKYRAHVAEQSVLILLQGITGGEK